jgi:hypothetical protein
VLTLHPDGGALRSEDERRDRPLLDSSLYLNDGRMIELPTTLEEEGADGMYPSDGARGEASPRRDTPRQGGREQEEEEEEEEEQQQQQEEARVSPRASSRAEGPSQPPTDERSENGGDGWRKRATSVVMAHFRYVRISSQSLSPWMQACKGSELSQRRLFTPLSMSTRTGLSSKAFRTARPAAARALATALKISCAWLALTCAANLANACC